MTATLVIMGGGAMGRALAGGLVDAGWAAPEQIAIVERLDPVRARIREEHPAVTLSDTAVPAAGAVLAVKPADAEAACASLAAEQIPRVLSIAAGVPISRLEGWLGPGTAVMRAMPNTPALVRSAASALSAGSEAGDAELDWAESILAAVGQVERVPEDLLDAVTGLSGSGPAYVFLLAEALEDAGVEAGVPRATARSLVASTLLGSARMIAESGVEPRELRRAVTSPSGTTEAGVRALEARMLRSAFLEAVTAATKRAHQLGEQLGRPAV